MHIATCCLLKSFALGSIAYTLKMIFLYIENYRREWNMVIARILRGSEIDSFLDIHKEDKACEHLDGERS